MSDESYWLPKDVEVKPVGDAFPLPEIDIKCRPFTSEADLRRFIRKEVHAALDDLAREIRTGVAFQPATTRKQAGTCCACLVAGDDMEWVGHRLAHKNDECRRIAAEMEPVREHRG